MFKIFWSGLNHSFILLKWEWTQWMFLCFMVSATSSLVTVHQPPLLAVALGHNVNLPCQLLSDDENVTRVMLYWMYNSTLHLLYSPAKKYEGRAHLLDHSTNSTNLSILLKNVQWADGGKYLCKVSVVTERDQRSRQKGNETLLIVYDTMLFSLTGHNTSQLQCEVNVTWDPRIVLSIFYDGWNGPNSREEDAGMAVPYVTLSETISPKHRGKYECRLHLDEDLITKSIFHWLPPAREGGDFEKCNSTCSSPGSEPDVCEACPEPWILYAALLLVPVPILLGLLTALFLDRY